MRCVFLLFITVFSIHVSAQVTPKRVPLDISDFPPNAQDGHCYVRRAVPGKKRVQLQWEDVDCALLNFQKLPVRLDGLQGTISKEDNVAIRTVLLPYIKDNYKIEVASHYDSRAAETINVKRSLNRGITLANHLVDIGVPPELISLRARGNLDKAKYIGFTYRLVNQSKEKAS